MIYKFTDGYSIVELKAGSYTEASKLVPIRYRLISITK